MHIRSLLAVVLLAACADTPSSSPSSASGEEGADGGTADSADRGDTGSPCDCDDGQYCNGVETCDDDGACVDGEPPAPEDDGDPCTQPSTCNDDTDSWDTVPITDDPRCTALPDVATHDPRDVAFWYWPENHDAGGSWNGTSHVLTGHYALAFNEQTGAIEHLGAHPSGWRASELLQASNSIIESFPAATLAFGAADGVVATSFEGVSASSRNRTRMIDGGQARNWLYVPTVRYAASPGLTGRVELVANPRHIVLTHRVWGADIGRISLSGAAFDGLTTETWLEAGRALELTDADGEGWLFVVQDPEDGAATLRREADGRIVAEQTGGAPDAAVSLLVTPATAWSEAERAMLLDPSTVTVQTTLLDKDGVAVRETDTADWDPVLGAYRAQLGTLRDAGAPSRWADWENADYHNWYGRHQVTIVPPGTDPLSVPLALHASDQLSFYVTGGAALLRDEDGRPVGVPVQHSKNWHVDNTSYGQGAWYHLSAQPTVSAETAMELTVASGRWGPLYAASHSQLSLIGWSDAGGHWQESALGAFGESVTYDPDETLRRAMVDDVRPFLVQADRRWSWTGNVGGADFLRYVPQGGSLSRLGRVRTWTRSPGPVLTDVVWSGVSADGHIEQQITSQLGATDDLVRVYYHLSVTFLEDTPYDRLAFFQVAADNYADNLFQTASWGDASGVRTTRAVPDHGTTGYASDADRGLPLSGTAPWMLLSDNARDWDALPEHLADVGVVVRHFEADIGGTVLTTPSLHVHRTNNGHSQLGFELGLPHEEGSPWCGAPCGGETRFIPAGSTVQATLEYLVIPNDPATYYGESDHLIAIPDEDWGTTAMMVRLAAGNHLQVEASVGTVVRSHPVTLLAEPGKVAAEFSVDGGLGGTPITVHGLNRHDGWTLWVSEDGADWTPLPGEVHGNDHLQAQQAEDGTWSLTWAAQNRGLIDYRLEWDAAAVDG